ncbi:hypothetical protein B0T25DRAFT_449554 [Lasiosphaeria hispida]|uniref:DUF6536 domain-containing protein n=1 Tax=Lasiosphaeria hispida TaxID=260671 RepID=A0AAJ0MIE7_9PEZI|nr:hypothetical protein B0T25DRAFT_449554 [Lasiosphaeria hispida]
MEIVIPPRDHGPSTFRYTWDENGEVQQVTRVRDESSTPPQRPVRGRQTVQWPFQSIATETEISSPTAPAPFARRATWQQPKRRDADGDSIDQDLIPDYVINYIRGETPETVARRKRNNGKLGERNIDIAHQHRPHESRAADFEGFPFNNETNSRLGSSDDGLDEERRHILSGSREKQERGWRKLMVGWRAGVALNVLLSFVILVAGFVCLVLAISKASLSAGKSVLFAGSCTTASNINWGLHAVINVFAVILLGGANYVFQVLSSPTRTEVAVAHFRKKWLDIGIPSFRNLAHIENSRTFLAVAILTAAALTQVIYNAVVFTSQNAVDYKVVLVTESFLNGAPFSNDTSSNSGMLSRLDILSLQQQANRGELVNLTTPECFQEFGGAFSTDFNAALLITNLNSQTSSLVQTSGASASISRIGTGGSIANLTLDRTSIKYCLAQRANEQTCEVALNGSLLGVVALLNLITVATVAAVLFKTSFQPLATLGDAIASFIKDPDTTTRGCCLLTKTDVWQGRWGLDDAKYWIPRDHYWFQTPSLPRWLIAMFMWFSCAGLAAAALTLSLLADPSTRLSPFGTASPYTVIRLPATVPDAAAALIACLPQLLLAGLYFATNSIMTAYFLSHESSLFAVGPAKPLRVSADAEGAQTTSLYLTLPRPASWFLITVFVGMGFVLSQSLFAVAIQLRDVPVSTTSTTAVGPETATIALGLSGVGLLAFLAILVLLATVVIALGCRRAPPAGGVNGQAVGNPMALPAGSCSAVISARCHAQPGERELWVKPMGWGSVREGVGMHVSHAAFTAGRKSSVDVSRCYA